MSGVPWKDEATAAGTLTSDQRIPRETVKAVQQTTEMVVTALDVALNASPLGKPEARVVLLRWKDGASALVAEPADDPTLIVAALWNALQATLDSLNTPVEEFLSAVMNAEEGEDADPR